MSHKTLQLIAHDLPVTGYLDYRDFLRDLYQRAKETSSPYSYLSFAEDCGFSAINTLRLVIAHQRQLSQKSAQKIAKALDLRNETRKYFLAMVQHVNARGAKLKDHYFQKMLEAKQKSVISRKDQDLLKYYGEWQHPIVREMLRLEGGPSAPEDMAAKFYPDVSVDRIQRSLALLETVGMITVDKETGVRRLVQDSPMLLPSDATAGLLAITRYHQSMIDVAREAVTTVPADRREINALTLSLSLEEFASLRGKIQEFCRDAMARENLDQRRECVAQLNLQLFTLTKWE